MPRETEFTLEKQKIIEAYIKLIWKYVETPDNWKKYPFAQSVQSFRELLNDQKKLSEILINKGYNSSERDTLRHTIPNALFRKTKTPSTVTLDTIRHVFELNHPKIKTYYNFQSEKNLKQHIDGNVQRNYQSEIEPEITLQDNFFTQIKPEDIALAESADDFFDGFPVEFSHIKVDFDFERDIYSKIKEVLNDITHKKKILIIRGVGGVGKSVLLKRIAFDLASKNKNVYFKEFDDYEVAPSINQIKGQIQALENPEYIVLDNCVKIINERSLDFVNLSKNFKNICFIIGLSNLKYNQSFKKLPSYLIGNFELKSLNDGSFGMNEIKKIVEKIEDLETNNRLIKKISTPKRDYDKIKELIENTFQKHLLVMLLQIRNAEPLKDIIKKELENIENEEAKEIYQLFCLFSTLNLPLSYEYASKAINSNLSHHDFFDICSGLTLPKAEGYLPRHNIIGSEVYKFCFAEDKSKIFETLKGVFDISYYMNV